MTLFDAQMLDLRRRYHSYLETHTLRHRTKQQRQDLAMLVMLIVCDGVVLTFQRNMWPLVAASLFTMFQTGRRLFARGAADPRERLAQNGVPISAVLVQANGNLFRPGSIDLPCLVLFSFEPAAAHLGYMRQLAQGVFALKETEQTDPDLRYVANLVTDERAFKYRRRKLPVSFTGGPTVYCADLWINRSYLPSGYLDQAVLPCMAEPGADGALELLPWWIAAGHDYPPEQRS